MTLNALKDRVKGDINNLWKSSYPTLKVKVHDWGSRRGITGRIRFPKDESWVIKNPVDCACACCKAAFCCAAKCCCSAWSLRSFIWGLESGMLAPGVFMDWLVWISLFLSFSSSARMATRVLFWKAGALAAMALKEAGTGKTIKGWVDFSLCS